MPIYTPIRTCSSLPMEGTRMAELQDDLELEQLLIFILPHETQFSTTFVTCLDEEAEP